MNDPNESPNSESLRNLMKDQMAQDGIIFDPYAAARKSEHLREDLAEEATWPLPSAKHAAETEAAPAQPAEPLQEENDYHSGMSQ